MKHHLMIAGTGRAGTSFLVRYLHACGLETHLSKHLTGSWDENANAGLEDFPTAGTDLPYVIKSPWLFEFVNTLLERDDVTLDAVIIPVRDLVEAAASRAIIELRARYASGQLPDDENTWETWATTPGGLLFSVNPLDEARLLAVGFHEVIRALVRHQVPIVFLDFPRFATDPGYTYSTLRDFIPVSREQAITAHASLADPSKIRTAKELMEGGSNFPSGTERQLSPGIKHPSIATVDLISLRREVRRLGDSQRTLSAEKENLEGLNRSLISARDSWLAERISLEAKLADTTKAYGVAVANASTLLIERDTYASTFTQREALLRGRINALETSTSWQLTSPIRAIKNFLSSLRRS